MAGSYLHLYGGWSMIENMGDAAECTHELWWLVERAIGRVEAERLLREEYYPMLRGEKEPDAAFDLVQSGMGDGTGEE